MFTHFIHICMLLLVFISLLFFPLAPAIIHPGNSTIMNVDENHFRYFQTFCPAFSHFIMIEEVDLIGTCSLYASTTERNPGKSVNNILYLSLFPHKDLYF